MQKFCLLLCTLLCITLSLSGQSRPHSVYFGGGLANFHNSYAENAPGAALHLGYSYALDVNGNGLAIIFQGSYQYHRFTSTRSSGVSRSNGFEVSDHRSHHARLQNLALGVGLQKQVKNFRFQAFVEGAYLLGARYLGFTGERENGGPEVLSDQFEISLHRSALSEERFYRIGAGGNQFSVNVGAQMSYEVRTGWSVGARYFHTVGYQEIGIESRPICTSRLSCEPYTARSEDFGSNSRGVLLLTLGHSF